MAIRLEDYAHSPAHYAVALTNHSTLSKLISRLPRLADPSQIHTESDSIAQETLAFEISSLLDRRDVPFGETPLHLSVRLNDPFAARLLSSAGADISLQNAAGWSPLQEAVCARKTDIALILLRAHHRAAWTKWRRRLPLLVAVLRRMRDFYMEISFHFESSLLPFVGRIAPSDTYRIWKRDGNLRADTSLAGFDGLKIHRADQSFLFLGDGDRGFDLPSGSLLVLNRTEKRVFDAFENAGLPLSASDEAGFWSQTSVYRPGMDVTRAELVSRTNWRNQTKVESIGEWKAKVYEVQNVVFSFRTRKVEDESVAPLELNEDAEEGFLVAENPDMGMCSRRHSSFEPSDFGYNNKGKMKEDREWVNFGGRKSVDLPPPVAAMPEKRRVFDEKKMGKKAVTSKESEYTKSLKPSVWLTDNFPLKIEELIPLLDILASKVKAVRRLRELLTTKFPPGTFPVKVAIPVVPTVRVVVTFTKFVDLQATEQFFTPLSSPRHLQSFSEEHKTEQSTWNSWLKRPKDESVKHSSSSRFKSDNLAAQVDPFVIPRDYTWSSMDDKRGKLKKSKSKKVK